MTLTELFTNIANAIRAKTGSTEPIVAEDFPSAIEAIEVGSTIDLDEEVTEQETIAASQDALVGDIMAALEGKAIGGGGKTTKTINIEWCDYEYLGEGSLSIEYISNNVKTTLYNSDSFSFDIIEADGGVVYIEQYVDSEHTSNVIELTEDVWVATQDGETIRVISYGNI